MKIRKKIDGLCFVFGLNLVVFLFVASLSYSKSGAVWLSLFDDLKLVDHSWCIAFLVAIDLLIFGFVGMAERCSE